MNKIWLVMAVVAMGMLGGCQSITPINKATVGTMQYAHELTKDNSGIIYGVATGHRKDNSAWVKEACDTVNNLDDRCSHQGDYMLSTVIPVAYFYAGVPHIVTLIPKSEKIDNCRMMKGSDCSFVKIKVEQGKIATLIEVVSSPSHQNDNCIWSGMPMVGGTICKIYNWDYRTSLRESSAYLGVITSVSK